MYYIRLFWILIYYKQFIYEFKALLEVSKDEQPVIAYKAIILIDELIMLCNKLLPSRHTLPIYVIIVIIYIWYYFKKY